METDENLVGDEKCTFVVSGHGGIETTPVALTMLLGTTGSSERNDEDGTSKITVFGNRSGFRERFKREGFTIVSEE